MVLAPVRDQHSHRWDHRGDDGHGDRRRGRPQSDHVPGQHDQGQTDPHQDEVPTLAAAQAFVTGPARQGMAIMAGAKAVIEAFRGLREASRRRSAPRPAVDEEESLFIG